MKKRLGSLVMAIVMTLSIFGPGLSVIGAEESSEESIQETADVVVIGSGGAGMSAAYEAVKAGGSVIVIDKNAFLGGNTLIAGSAMNAANPELQAKVTMSESELATIQEHLDLEPENDIMEQWQSDVTSELDEYLETGENYLYDSPSWHKLQTYVGGDYIADPELIEVLGDHALESINFLSELGAVWQEEISTVIGATWQRSHYPTQDKFGASGASFVLPQAEAFEELGGIVYLEHTAEELVQNEDGRIVGVRGVTADGEVFEFTADKGVVLATGGFRANVEMREQYNEHWETLDESIGTTNGPFATGDGVVMGEAIGANLVGMEWIQLIPSLSNMLTTTIDNSIYVNINGERFINEGSRRDALAGAILQQPEKTFYSIIDSYTAEEELGGVTYTGVPIEDKVDGENVIMGETIEELAEQLEMDPEVLTATVEAFNDAYDNGNDPMGRILFDQKLEKGPFYASKGEAQVHHTMGGVEINENGQVLNTEGEIISGLFAAGEVTGGIHGSNRLGGNAISDIVTFGRVAGQNVMAE